jgi:hypothetical protein
MILLNFCKGVFALSVPNYLDFKQYGMTDSILVDDSIYDDFSNAIYEFMLVTSLSGYGVVYKHLNKLRSGTGTYNVGMFSIMKSDKIILNIVIDVKRNLVFNRFIFICMKNHKSSENFNFDLFYTEFQNANLFHSHLTNTSGLFFTKINDIKKAFKLLEKIILMFI